MAVLATSLIGAVLGFTGFLAFVPQSAPYAVMQLRSTYLEQIMERTTILEVPAGEWLAQDDACLQYLNKNDNAQTYRTVTVTPVVGSYMQLRWRPAGVSIILHASETGGGVARLGRGNLACDISQRFTIQLPTPSSQEFVVFPVAGPAGLGAESIGSDHFLGGEIHLYGRAIMAPYHGALYPVLGDPIFLSEGGRLAAAPDLKEGQSWFGTARVTSEGMVISVVTETRSLVTIRASDRSEIEPLRIGLLTQLFQDPSVAPWSIGALFIVTVVQLVASFITLWPVAEPKPSASVARSSRRETSRLAQVPEGVLPEKASHLENKVSSSPPPQHQSETE